MKRLLVASDLSSRSDRALRRAMLLAREHGATVVILNVVDDDQPSTLIDREVDEARRTLEGQIAAADPSGQAPSGQAGVDVEAKVISGPIFRTIVEVADEENVEAIVMGAHRRRLLVDIFVGTTVERVIRTGKCPVLMVNEDPAGPYRDVLAAVDMSDASAHALEIARRLRLLEQVRLSVVHGYMSQAKVMMAYAGVDPKNIDEHLAESTAEATRHLTTFLDGIGFSQSAHRLQVTEGEAIEAITAAMEVSYPDLLVIGTRGRSGLKRTLLGSVAEQVLREAHCDVLAVPPAA